MTRPIVPQACAQELVLSQAAEDAAARLADAFPVAQGSVIGVEGDRVLIDLGAKKVYQGMELEVYREGDEVKHPVTGEVLGRRDKRLGLLRVIEVKEGFSESSIVSRQEGGNIRARDLVRLSSDRLLVALPFIDGSGVKGANVQSVTKDLAIALTKTGRFIVIEEPLLKAALMGEKHDRVESFTDPSILKLLGEKAHVQLLAVGKLSHADQGLFLNLQVMSVSTGAPLTVASVEVIGREPRFLAAPALPSGPMPRSSLGQASSNTSQPSLIQVERQPVEQLRSSRSEMASSQRPRLPREGSHKPETPSFRISPEDGSAQSGDKGPSDRVAFDLSEALLEVAAGDLDGDQRPEIVGMTSSEIIVYRWHQRQLVPMARFSSPSSVHHLHLDVGDVNGRGRGQIVVTTLSTTQDSLRSFILELQGDKLVQLVDGLDYFLRVLRGPGLEVPLLIGQRMGELTPFEGPIVRLLWNGQGYVEGQPLSLPVQVKNLYDFAPIKATGDQVVEIAVISKQRLKAYANGGKPFWEGRDDLGEVDHLVFSHIPSVRAIHSKRGLNGGIPANPVEYATRAILPRRILVEASPFGDHARVELLTLANSGKSSLNSWFGDGSPSSGRIVAFDRREGGFARGWETISVEGRVRDVALAELNGAGRKDLIVLSAVEEKGFVPFLQDRSHGIINVLSFIP